MPKSKRNRIVPLSVVKKKGKDGKKAKIEQIRNCLEQHKNVFIFKYDHLKTEKLQQIRRDWSGSRIFMGKNKVARVAFGKSPADEAKEGLAEAGMRLTGNRALLFTDASNREVVKYFNTLSSPAFATTGNMATETVVLDAGPLEQFPFALEPRLRALGLHTALKKGVVHLEQQQTICEAGKPLTADAARILELLGIQMAEFKLEVEYWWSEGKGLVDLSKEKEKKAIRKVRKLTEIPATPTRRSARVRKMHAVHETEDQQETAEDVAMELN